LINFKAFFIPKTDSPYFKKIKEKRNCVMNNQKSQSLKLAKMAMLVAISIVLVMVIHFPIFPMVAFLEYDPADIPILIGTFAFGPSAGILLTVVVSLLQGLTVSAGSGAYGIIMHILATTTLATTAGLIYRKHKTKKTAIIGLVAGTIAMAVVMFFANMVITPMFTGMPLEAIMQLMPFIIAFNVVKAGINSIVTFILYKRISPFLHR
jgi:riboflavin transporter FmnP